jgi:hypothetical protein
VIRTLLLASSALVGCATADLKGPPPNQGGPPVCGGEPVIACDAGAQGCAGGPRGADAGGGIYPIGCRAYFTAPDCSTESTCSCLPEDAGPARWLCQP